MKVQLLIKDEMSKHEERITREIRESNGKDNKLWETINKLKGKNKRENRKLEIFSKEGNVLSDREASEEIKSFWGNI